MDYQSGFIIDRDTMDSVAMLDQGIRRAIINKEPVVTVFLYIERNYDSLWQEALLFKCLMIV